MPTYEYRCDNCGHEFETYQSMKDEKLKKCPSCGQETLKRLIGSGGGLIFKGSGFYLTDYKNRPAESSKSAPSGAKEKEPAQASTDSIKSDKPKTDTTSTDTKSSGDSNSKKNEKKITNTGSKKD